MTLECITCGSFALTLKIYRSCVEIIYAILKGMIYETVHSLLINDVLLVLILGHRPSHTAVAEYADLVTLLGVYSMSHFSFRRSGSRSRCLSTFS